MSVKQTFSGVFGIKALFQIQFILENIAGDKIKSGAYGSQAQNDGREKYIERCANDVFYRIEICRGPQLCKQWQEA